MSVGSCTGKTDFEILKIVKEELAKNTDYSQVKIFNRAVEPNGYSLKTYKAAFREIPNLSGDERLTLQLCEKTFEEYKDEADREELNKFDIIHFVHCLYYIDIETALVHCMEKELSEDGRIVCIVRDMAFVERGGQKILSSENILKVADENRWKYETFPQEILIDITDIFEEEPEEGNVLLDFLTTVKKFRVKTSATEVKQAL